MIEKQTLENPERSSPFVQLLNYRREVFRDEGICALFWTDRETLAYLAEKAPDFWSFRSKTVEFPPEAEPGRLREAEAVTSDETPGHTSRKEIDERLKEIESQIAIYRSKEPPDENAVAGLLLEAGRLSFDKREMQDALRFLFESERIFRGLNLLPQQRNSLLWIGRTFKELGQLDSAERYLRQALDIDERLNSQPNLSTDYNNLSQIYQDRGELEDAEAWLRRAIAIDEKLGNEPSLATDYNNLSTIHQARGELKEAEACLRRAITIDEKLDDEPKLAIRYNNLSQIYQARGELKDAEAWLRRAIDIGEKLEDQIKLQLRYENYSQLLQQMNRQEEASTFEEKSQKIRTALTQKKTPPKQPKRRKVRTGGK